MFPTPGLGGRRFIWVVLFKCLCGLGILPTWLKNEVRGQNNRCDSYKVTTGNFSCGYPQLLSKYVPLLKKAPGKYLWLFLFSISSRKSKTKQLPVVTTTKRPREKLDLETMTLLKTVCKAIKEEGLKIELRENIFSDTHNNSTILFVFV